MSDRFAPDTTAGTLRFRRAFLLSLAVGISVLFFLVIRRFLLTVLLAAVFAGLAYPLYRWLLARLGRRIAAAATIVILLAGVGLPVAGFLTLVATEAVQWSQGAEAWLREEGRMGQVRDLVERIPFAHRLLPEGDLPDPYLVFHPLERYPAETIWASFSSWSLSPFVPTSLRWFRLAPRSADSRTREECVTPWNRRSAVLRPGPSGRTATRSRRHWPRIGCA